MQVHKVKAQKVTINTQCKGKWHWKYLAKLLCRNVPLTVGLKKGQRVRIVDYGAYTIVTVDNEGS
jgi:hypothetical protein